MCQTTAARGATETAFAVIVPKTRQIFRWVRKNFPCLFQPPRVAKRWLYKLMQNYAFEPKDIERLVGAYELTLRSLRLKGRDDPITHLVAQKIIAIGRLENEDPAEISKLALKELRTIP
jgi:hypothetical protein